MMVVFVCCIFVCIFSAHNLLYVTSCFGFCLILFYGGYGDGVWVVNREGSQDL